MRSSDINALLADEISAVSFKSIIAHDVETYSRLMDKKGASIPLNFTEDGSIFLDRDKFIWLLQQVSSGQLSNIDLAYICDCFTMAENIDFNDEVIKDYVHDIADPEINGGYKSANEIALIVSALSKQ